ncbi:MAG: DNA primase [bacterium]
MSNITPYNTYNDAVTEIKNRLNVVETISEHIILKKKGRNFWGLCPFHNEKSPSFSVNEEKGIFKCFGCGAGGDSISFLMKLNAQSFHEVIVDLAHKFNIVLPSHAHSTEKTEIKKQLFEINEQVTEFYKEILKTSPLGEKAREYLKNRGITEETIENFSIGYAPNDFEAIIKKFDKKYSLKLLETAGLVIQKENSSKYYDRFRDRIIVPIKDEFGNYIAFGARTLNNNQNPKYLNSPDTPVFNKSKNLFGLYQAKDFIKFNDSVIFTEGYFDVIALHTAGINHAVATLGTAITEQHIKLVSKYTKSRKLYLAFDNDNAGVSAANRGAEIIKSAFQGLGEIKQFDESYKPTLAGDTKIACEIRIISSPQGKDPDEIIRNEGALAFEKLIKNAPLLIDYQINKAIANIEEDLSPQDKFHKTSEIIPILAEVKNSIIRDEYISIVSEKLGVKQDTLSEEVKKLLQSETPVKKPLLPVPQQKKLEKHVLAQKNLLSFYFIYNENLPILCINNYLKEAVFTEPIFILLKEKIEKIISENEDLNDISEMLLSELNDNNEAKALVADIIFSLDDKKCLDEKQSKQYIEESILCIKQYLEYKEHKNLKDSYHTASDELSALQIQYKVREMIKSSRQRLEKVNDQT